ncbi:Nitroimidazol reductase NimA, pyridoxamine 5'-phosphate oxidase superfamily [Actinopolyspora xinjiangensis]|uniref:Nitroimidazol reductase NimA, pyridoxamine 5'-phosphate oxidase superfamily n=1 Tax=Actinopolyspora xinjiangensis TaxID=405564 RepID=A0A1H0RLH1_9ACTN|nr:pyridoxamine 5'-phosphate oxidase family protein [Actinopolyspora xinjiangensis]SDP30305.1 Nitroimidazol reductase NimA, pyridoxamine 5'-phosphate oxidase superfamily [Actinopolyspora xinjiangensis]
MNTHRELRPLTTRESIVLLSSAQVGRVVFTDEALPAIRPVNFVVDGPSVVLRTGGEGSLSKLSGNVVAFEVDHIDSSTRSGWSVIVHGRAERVSDIEQLVALADPAKSSWVPIRDYFLRIPFDMVTGRRLALSNVTSEISN